jgi:hypothetical protein
MRLSPNLTINAGCVSNTRTEFARKDDRMLVGFDPNAVTAISSGPKPRIWQAAFRTPRGMLPSISVRGGTLFATDSGQDGTTWNGQAMWMPRVSGAYKLGERTVVKGGIRSLLRHAERG